MNRFFGQVVQSATKKRCTYLAIHFSPQLFYGRTIRSGWVQRHGFAMKVKGHTHTHTQNGLLYRLPFLVGRSFDFWFTKWNIFGSLHQLFLTSRSLPVGWVPQPTKTGSFVEDAGTKPPVWMQAAHPFGLLQVCS